MPEFPERIAYVYEWYKTLSWHEVSPSEIKAYFDCLGIKPTPWEFELLLALHRDSKSD